MSDEQYWDAESAAKRIDKLEHKISIRNDQITDLRARNDKLDALYTNERILRYGAETDRNGAIEQYLESQKAWRTETERCAKIAREYGLSPVVGKAIAALIMEGR